MALFRRCGFLVLWLIFSTSLIAQRDYFQQDVAYDIKVRLDDNKNMLYGSIGISYKNNSPDTLKVIMMHLWPNAYKNDKTALVGQMIRQNDMSLYYASEEEKGYIDSLDFHINGSAVKWAFMGDSIDIATLYLTQPLAPGDSLMINTPFRVKIPDARFSRLGHVGQSYMITQWYPKPAVYDRDGWHPVPYLNQGEFYSEFGRFNVSITLPKNYVVGATGVLQNDDEQAWMDYLAEKTAAKDSFSYDISFPPSDKQMKNLNYRQDHVHDFGWFADKRFNVLKGQVKLPASGRYVTTWALFTNEMASIWKNSIEYINDATYYYSLWNGDYPYSSVTAVDGTISAGSGMEYPMITVVSAYSPMDLEVVIMHEVGHNWYYGILGSNERDHGWMDEGMNTYAEDRYMATKYPHYCMASSYIRKRTIRFFHLEDMDHHKALDLGYLVNARRRIDQPIDITSDDYTPLNYGGIVYGKTGLVFRYLQAFLGDTLFDKCMHNYYTQWHFKHPQPDDVRQVFENTCGKKMPWFFDDVIKTTKHIDYKLCKAEKDPDHNGQLLVTVKNKGEISAPFSLSVLKDDSILNTYWYDGVTGTKSVLLPHPGGNMVRLDAEEWMPETKRSNNSIRTEGIFRKRRPIQLGFLGTYENPYRKQLFFAPVAAWNKYDQLMPGLAIYNSKLPGWPLDWFFAGMYSTGTGGFAGNAGISYNLYPARGFIQSFSPYVRGRTFHYSPVDYIHPYRRLESGLKIVFKQPAPNKKRYFSFKIKEITASDPPMWFNDAKNIKETFNHFLVANLFMEHKASFNPWKLKLNLENGPGYSKSFFTGSFSRMYSKHGVLGMRLFAGAFLRNNGSFPAARWQMGGMNGATDYMFDEWFLGRSETDYFLSQQFHNDQGGFAVNAPPVGRSDSWLVSSNIHLMAPVKIPIGLYLNTGLYPLKTTNAASNETIESTEWLYESGVYIQLINDVVEVFVPLDMSDQYDNYLAANGIDFLERIRFTIHLEDVRPFERIREFQF